jgi:lipopolysaccharide transport system ATP-binding protein
MEFWILSSKSRIAFSFHVFNSQGICLFVTANLHEPESSQRRYEPGLYRSSCTVPGNYLNEGQHYVSAFVVLDANSVQTRIDEAVSFYVHDAGTTRGGYTGGWGGVVRPLLPWTVRQVGGL